MRLTPEMDIGDRIHRICTIWHNQLVLDPMCKFNKNPQQSLEVEKTGSGRLEFWQPLTFGITEYSEKTTFNTKLLDDCW